MDIIDFALKTGVAVIAGLCIGLEREFRGKHAGLKTHALVALGASIFIMMSLEFEGAEYADMTRVLSQVIIGIGFIGAGTIMKKGKDVEGLTTAATIWCSAAIGCLSGFGYFKELVVTTILIIFVNFFFSLIERKLMDRKKKEKSKD
ncbi:MgtC/SapB family protein [Gramella sp. MAR_2010_147]|uniref:MgtC/SapB family protein n=1 Tax=Gramella sp. MAR_2010_147 TaxID=1250205 RepID=UPI000879DF7A|nr:MgtC/SapB family protein [Gramella sp. MAR_2010_147]SDS26251.1 putative Mg2+ transporter-C (MgtC) family protein [Gramella sp. MAR_2010_147]